MVFHGWMPEPEKLLQQADIAVLPWRWQEPFGLVGPEAMGYALPLVGFDRGGIGEYLIPDETGLLVPPNNPRALGEAISRLLADPALRKKMGANGREFVREHFSCIPSVE